MNILKIIKEKQNYNFSKKDNNLYISYLLNSDIMKFYAIEELAHELNKPMLLRTKKRLPLHIPENVELFQLLLSYIEVLESTNDIHEYVSNNHIINSFREVLNALIYELYFSEIFTNTTVQFEKRTGIIEFSTFVKRDFKSIEGLTTDDSINLIRDSYNTLKQPYNEIRNNLILMTIYFKSSVIRVMHSQF